MTQRAIVVLAVAMIAAPSTALASGLDLRLGAYFPSANSNLFSDDATLYTRGGNLGPAGLPPGLSDSDWIGVLGGLEYSMRVARNVEVGFHVDGYHRSFQTAYRAYTRPGGGDITQELDLDIVPVGVSLRIVPTSRRAKVAPYIAAGVDAVYWHYREIGDFIDFQTPGLPIHSDAFYSDGVAFGFHVAGGVRFAVSDDVSIVGEARYLHSSDDMGGDFFRSVDKNYIDLSGIGATLGVHIRF